MTEMTVAQSLTSSGLPLSSSVSHASRLFAIFLGLAVPSVAFGRVVFAGFVGFALISLFFCRSWRDILRDLITQCRTPVGMLVLLTFVAWLPNVLISNFPLRSFEAVSRTLILVGIGSAFCSCLSTDRRLIDISLRTFTIMAAISVAFALISMTVLPEFFWAMRLEGWLSQPVGTKLKGFSALAVVIVPVLVLAGYRSSLIWKVVGALISATFLVLVWETYNRAAIAGFLAAVISVVLAVLMQRGSKKNVLTAMAGAIVMIGGVILWLRTTRGFLLGLAPQENWFFPVWLIDYERQTIWEKALEFASMSPWFGIGANTINFVPGADAIIKGTQNLHVIPAHPHNWAVEVMAETGAVGLATLLITIGVMGVRTLLSLRRTGNLGLVCVTGILAGYWGSGLFNFSYWSAWWQVSFLLALALCYSFANIKHKLE